jgi:hypothetical protein
MSTSIVCLILGLKAKASTYGAAAALDKHSPWFAVAPSSAGNSAVNLKG